MKNWPKYLLQWGVLAALVAVLTGLFPSEEPADPEAYCPVGGLQALTTYLVNGSLPCSMTTLQIMMGVALAAAVILFSKLFCGYLCPLGTVQDLLRKLRNLLHVKSVNIRNGSVADKVLRIVKYVLLFWIFYMTATTSELFCKNLDPYYAVATGFKGEITLWMSVVSLTLVVLGAFFVDMFWCRYICPLGAVSNSLKFWVWAAVLVGVYYVLGLAGLELPWWLIFGLFCLMGYLLEILNARPKLQILHVMKDSSRCIHCGRCTERCPYHIDVNTWDGGPVNSVDCTLCGECVAVCPVKALHNGVCRSGRPTVLKKMVPAVLTAVLVAAGMWAGSKFELPTIDMTWGIVQRSDDGTEKYLVDPESLQTLTVENLRSVKCYGSSMAFKAKVEKVRGVHGVKTFVGHHRVEILYDPAVVTPEKIQEEIYTPSLFRVQTPDIASVDSVKVMTVRTENMYDRMDLNFLGLQMRESGRKIYGLESEFACPLIVRVYMDPSESPDKAWFKEMVEKDKLVLGTKEYDLDYRFEGLEDTVSYMSAKDYVRKMFSPFKAEFKSRVMENEGKPQFIYKIADRNYEKIIVKRNMPFLSNHLSRNEGVIGVYLDLDEDFMPAIMVRYAAPMTAEKLWGLMTMDTWTITYSENDVREVPAKLGFKTPGVEKPYVE